MKGRGEGACPTIFADTREKKGKERDSDELRILQKEKGIHCLCCLQRRKRKMAPPRLGLREKKEERLSTSSREGREKKKRRKKKREVSIF